MAERNTIRVSLAGTEYRALPWGAQEPVCPSVLRDPTAAGAHSSLWRFFAAAGIAAAYALSVSSKPSSNYTPQRRRSSTGAATGPVDEEPQTNNAA